MEKEAAAKMLEKDELVLWSGKPAPFKIMDKYYKPVFLRNYSIALLIAVIIFTATMVLRANDKGVNVLAVVVIVCIPLVLIPSRIFTYRNYGKKCQFLLTNENIIIYVSDTHKLRFPLSDIDKFESVQQSEGTWSIRIGNAVGIPAKKNRDFALDCLTKNTAADKNKGCLMYNLSEKDARAVLELIDKYRVVV